MTIIELKHKRIVPFELDDGKLRKIFSFFLHMAPTINSVSAANIPSERLEKNWVEYIESWKNDSLRIYSSNSDFPEKLDNYGLGNDSVINRNSRAVICKRHTLNSTKTGSQSDYECVLTHLRNAIAHGYVYLLNGGNRKYILFEDFAPGGIKKTATMLFSQTEMERLKRIITK